MVRLLRTPLAILLISAMLIPLLAAGCGSAATTQTRAETDARPKLQGWVAADGPVSGATLTIYNAAGKKIYDSSAVVTDDIGSFDVEVDHLPSDFRITASGGTNGGERLASSLSADYRGFDQTTGVVRINLVTTMVSAYMDKHSGKTLAEATAAVKRYLDIPEAVDIGAGLDSSERNFVSAKFIQEAAANGGLEQFITGLVTEMDQGGAGKRTFRSSAQMPNAVPPGPGGYVAGMLMSKIGGSLMSYGMGKLLGAGLSKIGLNFGDSTAEDIKEMKAQLSQISNQLTALSTQMSDMQQALTGQIHYASYNARIYSDPLASLVTKVKGSENNPGLYQNLVDFYNKKWDNEYDREYRRQALVQSIGDQLLPSSDATNVTYSLSILHNQLSGTDYGTPLLTLWSLVVQDRHRFLTAADSSLVYQHYYYWDAIQQWTAELLVEYFQAKYAESDRKLASMKDATAEEYKTELSRKNAFEQSAKDIYSAYDPNRVAQQKKAPAQIAQGAFVDIKTGKMWMQRPVANYTGGGYKTTASMVNPDVISITTSSPFASVDREALFKVQGGPMWFVYGELRGKDRISTPNAGSPLNRTDKLTIILATPNADRSSSTFYDPASTNLGFHDWIMPTQADLWELTGNYAGGNATVDWFVKNGAFPEGSTLGSVWGNSGGNVWTGLWFWDDGLGREVVSTACIGVWGRNRTIDGKLNGVSVAILNEGSARIGSLFPYRLIPKDEFYYAIDPAAGP